MVQKLTSGLHIITKHLGLCTPNEIYVYNSTSYQLYVTRSETQRSILIKMLTIQLFILEYHTQYVCIDYMFA